MGADIRQEGGAESLPGHVISRHELVEVEADVRRHAVVLEQPARTAEHVIAFSEDQEVCILESCERYGRYIGKKVAAEHDVLLRQQIRGKFPIDGQEGRHGQQQVILVKGNGLVERFIVNAAVDDDVEFLCGELVKRSAESDSVTASAICGWRRLKASIMGGRKQEAKKFVPPSERVPLSSPARSSQ